MPKKKSLADELADLFNPAPTKEFDPEADVFGAGPALEDSDEELAADAARKRGKEGARLRGDIVMEGREYAGRRSSRAAVFGGEDEEEEEESGSEEEGSDGEGGEEREEGSGEEELSSGSGSEEEREEGSEGEGEDAGWLNGHAGGSGSDGDSDAPEEAAAGGGGAARRAAVRAAGASDSEGGSEGEEEEGRRGGGEAGVAAAADDEMAALEREYEQMQQDEQAAMAGLKERAARERRKALAVQAQKAVWQRGLEARILLQRQLAGANRLPQGAMQAAAAASDPQLDAAYRGLAADASALLDDMLQLLGALAEQNPAIGEAAAAAGVAAPEARGGAGGDAQQAAQQQGQRGSEALWERLDAAYAGVAPFRDASIDRWHRKTALTSGGATLRGGQLKALNQSVSTQVAQLMQDPGKVLQRARLPRSALQQPKSRLLCPDPDAPAPKRARWGADEEGAQDNGAAAAEQGLEEDRDPETFDDTEFYQTLLREFLEGSAGGGGGGGWHSGPKQRKAVDRRASKGRKLRYHVHPKLVNFMTPVELDAPQYAAQLFSNLFGGGGRK